MHVITHNISFVVQIREKEDRGKYMERERQREREVVHHISFLFFQYTYSFEYLIHVQL